MARPVQRRTRTTKPQRKAAGAETPKDARVPDAGGRAPREGLIERIDRMANRPFLQGDYMPGEIRGRGGRKESTPTGRRRR
jgi:hypothetical protein